MDLTAYFSEFKSAIQDEISVLRQNGGTKVFTSGGYYLSNKDNFYFYNFSCDSELRLPEDVKVDVELNRNKYTATIVSIESFNVILALKDFLGNKVEHAVIHASPWFLLEELQSRLTELQAPNNNNTKLINRLLEDQQPAKVTIQEDWADAFLRTMSDNNHKPIPYNTSQLKAVATALSRDITFVWGPPGTGKTKTLGMTAAALINRGESVLLVAHSNAAVDVAMRSLAECVNKTRDYEDGKILRYGLIVNKDELKEFPLLSSKNIVRKQDPQLVNEIERLETLKKELVKNAGLAAESGQSADHIVQKLANINNLLNPLIAKINEKEDSLVREAKVVGCTFSKASISDNIYARRFDAVLIDEASMAYIPHCAMVTALAKNRVAIFGDFRQLAPIAQGYTSSVKKWLKRDIFDQSKIIEKVESNRDDPKMVLLKTQYRMHPEIAAIPNRLFYKNKLENGPNVLQSTAPIANSDPGPGHPVMLLDLTNLLSRCLASDSGSRFNPVSALTVVALCHQALRHSESIGVVTPYSAQSRLINKMVRELKLGDKIKVSTVHRFQGSERDIILFDTVDAPKKKPGLIFGEDALRLVNVAVSRPKGKFVLLAHVEYIKNKFPQNSHLGRLIGATQNCYTMKPAYDWLASQTIWAKNPEICSFFKDCVSAKPSLENDIRNAKKEIAISWPCEFKDFHFALELFRQLPAQNVNVFLRGNDAFTTLRDKGLNRGVNKSEGFTLPLGIICIDNSSLWIYTSPESKNVANITNLRLKGSVGLINSFLQLAPSNSSSRHEVQITAEKSSKDAPFGKCPKCGTVMWVSKGYKGHYLKCRNGSCNHTRSFQPADLSNYASLFDIKCGDCGSQLQGRLAKKTNTVFLGCTNYPKCKSVKFLNQIFE